MADHSALAADASSSGTSPFKKPSPYPPCIRAVNELRPIAISQMKLETHHLGKRTVVRILSLPERNVALMAMVMDKKGATALLQLFYQPFENVVPAEQTLRHGRFYLIKEPYATVGPGGSYSLRVDHPTDIILLPHGHELLPAKLRESKAVVGSSDEIRMKGNDAVGKKRWAEAEDLYTTAAQIAETSEEARLAYLNRSLANLRLGRPATALADAIKSYGGDASERTEKDFFREASALYDLAKYDQCLDTLQALRAMHPSNGSATPMIERVQERLQEQRTGQYNFRRMYKQAKATPPLIDCATYTVPVEIRDSPGKGRGVFTTRKVLAGEMLICEKAFGYTYAGADHPDSRDMGEVDVLVDLRTRVVQRLLHNVEDARLFGELHHGDPDAISVYEVDGRPVIDSFVVGDTIAHIKYQGPRINLSVLEKVFSGDERDKLITEMSATGVWPFISHINHSCISNVDRSFIGDMLIIRATKDLEAGAELLVSYNLALPAESYEDAQNRVSAWGFTCDCALCLDKKATPAGVILQRKVLLKETLQSIKIANLATSITKSQRTLDQLSQTYSAAAKEPGAVRLELWDPCHALGCMLTTAGKPTQAIEMILRGLEAVGFIISATPPRSVAKSSKPEFRIRQWGLVDAHCVDAFRVLHQAYKTISSENSAAAKGYMEIAYSMFVGEKETILDTYPEIA